MVGYPLLIAILCNAFADPIRILTRRVSVLENVAKWDGNMHAMAQRISNKIQNGVAGRLSVDQVLEEVCVGEQVHTQGTELFYS